jgi:hypothetical protein
MRTAIDSNVISAIWSGAPPDPELIARLGEARREGVLLVSPFVFTELHAYPGATEEFLLKFLEATEVVVDYRLEERVWSEAGIRFARYAARRRELAGTEPMGLMADFLIGAHALVQADRFLTLDPKRYTEYFPEVQLF